MVNMVVVKEITNTFASLLLNCFQKWKESNIYTWLGHLSVIMFNKTDICCTRASSFTR